MKSFFNTNKTEGAELVNRIEKCHNQEQVVLALFEEYPRMTASECLNKYIQYKRDYRTPITSIRRAITVLTNKGILLKSEDTRIGDYGAKEHYYLCAR